MSRPGRLDRRLEILRDTGTTQDALGSHTETWAVVGSRWSEIQPGRGAERFIQESERTAQAVTIVIRYDELTLTLTPRDRVRYSGDGVEREYDIVSVSDRFTEHRYVELLCTLRGPESSRAG